MRARILLAFLLFVITSQLACAFGTRNVNLQYGGGILIPPARAAGRIAIARFTDARDAGRRVGILRNLYGMPTARISAKQDPPLWVSEGIARALTAAGLSVEKVDIGVRPAGIATLSGIVRKIATDGYSHVEVTIQSDVTLDLDETRLMQDTCTGSISVDAGTQSAAVYQDAFMQAMDRFLYDCVSKVLVAMGSPR